MAIPVVATLVALAGALLARRVASLRLRNAISAGLGAFAGAMWQSYVGFDGVTSYLLSLLFLAAGVLVTMTLSGGLRGAK